jgi:hypothetical protein
MNIGRNARQAPSAKPMSYPSPAARRRGKTKAAQAPGGGGRPSAATAKSRRVSSNEKYPETLELDALALAARDVLDLAYENSILRRELASIRRLLRTALHDLQRTARHHQAAQRA